MDADYRAAFAKRLHEICDDHGLPRERGRYAALTTALRNRGLKLTWQAIKKWLDGAGYPDMDKVVLICEWANVNINWLLQGHPPKTGERVNVAALRLAEGLSALPAENRQAVLEFMRYEFGRADGWFTNEALQRYLDTIDTLRRQSADMRPPPPHT